MHMWIFGGAVMVSAGGGYGGDVVSEQEPGAVSQLLAGLPAWASALLVTVGVLIAAAVVGMIIGKMYASIRYPDPEKQGILSPKIKVLFLCILAACAFWLYSALTKQDDEVLPVGGESSSYAQEGGREEAAVPAVAVKVPM